MSIRPILSALLRHKTAALLIVVEIALSCAIICNATFMVTERVQRLQRASGIVEDELIHIQAGSLVPDREAEAMRREDVALLRAVPGVTSVTSINQMPYGSSQWSSSVNLEPDQAEQTLDAAMYMDDGTMLETFGLPLVEGRDFGAEEYIDLFALQRAEDPAKVPSVILTQQLAQRLFPGESPLGKNIYVFGNDPTRVVGVVGPLLVPGSNDGASYYEAMILPIRAAHADYVLRTEAASRDEVLKAASDALTRADPLRIVAQESVTAMREGFYSRDRAVIWLLVSVCVALLVVTALGIVGLASFWVQQRTKQIGIRRALGATRAQILRYFQAENFLLACFGIALGMLLAFGINQLLMSEYEMARLPWPYLPVGAAILWALGQIAVLGPARRAASVPPATATRSA